MNTESGFIKIIIIIVLILVIISLLGISLKEIFTKLSSNPQMSENFIFVKNWLVDVYNKYLSGPVGEGFAYLKNYLFGIFPESKKVIPTSEPATNQSQ